jgi:hypothetical protein
MSDLMTSRERWLLSLVDLLERRPELADIGYAPIVREVAQ